MKLQTCSAVLAAAGLSVLPGVAAAKLGESGANGDIPSTIPGSAPGDLLGGLVWVIVSLAIVITLIVLVIKWLSNRSRAWGANRSMRSLGGIALGQNSSMQVVEIAGKIYIVGVGETITLLDKMDDPDQVAQVISALEKQTENVWTPKDVASMINRWRGKKEEEKQPANERWNESASFQQLLQSKLSQQAGRKEQIENLLNKQNTNERLMDDEK
ncbi:flagellar biosynthetic protein FliO [Paenibacillus sp. LHD-117]|uniref:flagellar biosynthetic protein FliO n=1 Tax=Paenibacillus sp. LHD-117 TaxID=3071412 RepID=UPI0027E09CE6|nr:flagellar biosynthetic protein FliO [Paenibacillus sp. LHD-117]MDQ6419246.1 flagellar biosynthetic protein FliO [Paenibacillus sp. LHD-117]